jgi:hypothetical protein
MSDQHGESHGNTVAAWTAVAIILIGFTIGGVGMWLASPVTFWAGVVVVVVGAITGKVLQLLGFGQKPVGAESAAQTS